MAFKNFLLEFSNFDDYPMPSIIIWEHYLVYATEFGIADLVEEQMRLKFKKMDLNINEYIEVNNSLSSSPSTAYFPNVAFIC